MPTSLSAWRQNAGCRRRSGAGTAPGAGWHDCLAAADAAGPARFTPQRLSLAGARRGVFVAFGDIPMATGWAGDGAVQDQIDATIKDAIKRARSQLPSGPGLTHCE